MIHVIAIITTKPGKREEYLRWRRHSVFPYMASHEGFLGSVLLSTDDPNSFVIFNKWVSRAAEEAYIAHPREAELRVEARQFVVDLVSQSFDGEIVDVWSAPQ
ncbi:MAG: antibiotic biosynthesis monooxygenase [Rhodospirillales bacterium]|nr:antibiotic biosynthesis monooxygenase [Rhodospirillales bacterium]